MKFWKYIKYKLSNSNDDNDLNNEIDDKKELDQNHNNKEESKQNIESHNNNNSQEQLKDNNQVSPNSEQLSSNNGNNYQESLSNNLNTNTSQNYSNESDEQYNQKSSSNNGSNSNGMNNQNNDTNNNQNQDYLQKDFKNDLDGNVSNKVGNNDLINQINNQINQHIFDNTLSDKSKEQIGQSNNDNKLNDEENLSNSKSENNSLKSQNNNDLTNINSMKKNNSNISKEKLNSSINSIDENNNTGKTNNISNEKNQDLDKNIKRNEVINENDNIDINQTSNNLENNSNKNSLNQLSNNQKQRNNNDKSSGKEENSTNDNNKLKRELLKKLSDKLKKYKVKSEKVVNRKREKLTKELKDIEESTEEKYELSDQTNQFLDELKDLPSFDERDRGPGYSINTISYTDVPESVIKTLISKFLNQRFCKHNTDLNSQSNSLEKSNGFYKWEVKDVITHLKTHQVTKVLTDKYGYQYAEGKSENVPLSFYFDMSGSMSKYTNMLAVIAIELLKKDVKVLIGFNERVNVQIDKIDKNIEVEELADILKSAGYYYNENKIKSDSKVTYKVINRNIDNYLIEKKAEKCVVFADFDPREEVINLSQKLDVYWFCFENNFNKYDLSNYCGFIYKVCNLYDLEQGLIKVNQKRFETLCYTENPINLKGKVRVKK